jgi:hypothetical protein
MNKLGAQCQMNSGALLDYCRVVRPKAAMGIMVQERSFYRTLADLHVESIYRHFPNEGWHDPEYNARQFVRCYLKPETAGFVDLLTYVLGYNEYIHATPHMTDEARDRADRFSSTLIQEVHEQLGIHAIVLNLNTGHFRDDVLVFKRTLEALDACGKCRLGWHEYGWPAMYTQYCDGLQSGNDGCWHTLRWKPAALAIRKAGYHNVKFAITECGIDGGVSGLDNLGWRRTHEDFWEALHNYRRSLAWYVDALERDPVVDFALVFGCGLNDDWRGKGFELPRELWEWIRDYKIYPEVKL